MCVSKRLFWLLGGRWTGASRLAGPAVMGAAPLRQRTGPGLEPQLPAGWGQEAQRGLWGGADRPQGPQTNLGPWEAWLGRGRAER